MTTTKQELSEWFDAGVAQNATHMIVVCDTFEWDDYPVYVMPGEDVHAKVEHYDEQSMQEVMEVYSLRLPKEAQLNEHRAFHFE